jgi:hypothetical protein
MVIVLPLVRFQPGERLRVVRGAFVDRTGIYSNERARQSARLVPDVRARSLDRAARARRECCLGVPLGPRMARKTIFVST